MAKVFGIHSKAPVTLMSTTAVTITPVGFGTISSSRLLTYRIGDRLYAEGSFIAGTTTAVAAALAISGVAMDSSKLGLVTNGDYVGDVHGSNTTSGNNIFNGGSYCSSVLMYDGSDTANLYFVSVTGTASFIKENASVRYPNGTLVSYRFSVPISGWSANDTLRISDDTKI